jgi:hypothetical protein
MKTLFLFPLVCVPFYFPIRSGDPYSVEQSLVLVLGFALLKILYPALKAVSAGGFNLLIFPCVSSVAHQFSCLVSLGLQPGRSFRFALVIFAVALMSWFASPLDSASALIPVPLAPR